MALTKATDLGNGYSAEYFRITKMITDLVGEACIIRVCLYKDEGARTDGKAWVSTYEYEVAMSTIFDKAAETVDNPLHAAYVYLKTLAFYSGAADS